jgi:AAA+ ATPase superfamily predicted ATPase
MDKVVTMTKEFNITGTCIPELHYMADISRKLKPTLDLVERGKYFVISRPRQYGKTTILVGLHRFLAVSEAYFPISISFEGMGPDQYATDLSFGKSFLNLLKAEFFEQKKFELATWLESQIKDLDDSSKLDSIISELIRKFPKKVVLLIDEVDRSGNNEVFVRFLGLLRSKYLSALRGSGKTFHSLILAGLHDVKTLKSRLRPHEDQQFNSPWNIASEYPVDLSLSAEEIIPMLEEYQKDTSIHMDAHLVAHKLMWLTLVIPS